jgi:hypothetical protein
MTVCIDRAGWLRVDLTPALPPPAVAVGWCPMALSLACCLMALCSTPPPAACSMCWCCNARRATSCRLCLRQRQRRLLWPLVSFHQLPLLLLLVMPSTCLQQLWQSQQHQEGRPITLCRLCSTLAALGPNAAHSRQRSSYMVQSDLDPYCLLHPVLTRMHVLVLVVVLVVVVTLVQRKTAKPTAL